MIQQFKHDFFPSVKLETTTVDDKRHYITPTGEVYKSVTSVLSHLESKKLDEWRARVGEAEAAKISGKATRRGKRVHSIAEQFLWNNPLPARIPGIMPSDVAMFKSIRPFMERISVVRGIEHPLYSHKLRSAGTADCLGDFDLIPSVIDFKTSRLQKQKEWIRNYFLQCTAYSIMVEERYGIVLPQIVIIIACDEDNPQLFVDKVDNYRDDVISIFQKWA